MLPQPCWQLILAREAEAGANEAGGKAIVFNTITASDGISMRAEGMKYSLVSREVIADSIETIVGAEGMDGFVAIGECDKNMTASARLNRPADVPRSREPERVVADRVREIFP
jgi:dihydroxy-acid dehydratase